MAKVEIDETELANLKRVNDVAALIGKHPKARAMLQEAVALAAPDEVGPEHRIRVENDQRISGMEKKFDEFLEEQKKEREERSAVEARRDLERRWMEGRRVAREEHSYTDEGLKSLEEFMEREGIPDHKNAIPAFERANPPPEPVVTGGRGWNFFDRAAEAEQDAAMKSLLSGNDEDFLARAVPAALKEVRGG